jgi:protein-S-isoprenylcysteine O-methyltransferase Ste14
LRRAFAIIRAVVLMAAVWLAIGWATGLLRPIDVSLGVELPGWVQVPGGLAVAAGAVGVLACGVMLSTLGIGTLPGERFMPRDFLASGPFRFVRNPMSLAGVVLMIGIALWHRSPSALAVAAGLFLIFHLVIVRVEEPGLERRFGESYRAYKHHVPRWLPRWTPWSGGA